MKEEIRCLAQFKVGRTWVQCTHAQGHGGRHWYHSKRGYRSFTDAQARYWPVPVMRTRKVKPEKLRHMYLADFVKANPAEGWQEFLKVPVEVQRKMYEEHPTPVDALKPSDVTRVPVKHDFTGLNWDFIQLMAEIVPYADAKYTSFAQFALKRLTGQASPLNHVITHAKQFIMGEPYDHFDGKPERHLAAIAYNASMEYLYIQLFGYVTSPLSIAEAKKRIAEAVTQPDLVTRITIDRTIDRPKKRRKKRK